MISFTITDLDRSDAKVLRAIADAMWPASTVSGTPIGVAELDLLVRVEEKDGVRTFISVDKPKVHEIYAPSVFNVPGGPLVGANTIAPADNPAAGGDILKSENIVTASNGIVTEVLTAGNLPDVLSVFATGGTVPVINDGIKALGDAIGAALGAPLPNVPSPTPIPPPAPLPTLPTSPPPLPGAPSDLSAPPPPPAPAPVDVSGGAPTTQGVPTDKDGLPWDARIHASTKTKTAKDVWTRRRGVTDELVVEVEAQLRQVMSIAPAPQLVPAPAWPFPDANPHAAPTFPDLMAYITPRINAATLTQQQVVAAVKLAGVDSLSLVMHNPALIPNILANLRAIA